MVLKFLARIILARHIDLQVQIISLSSLKQIFFITIAGGSVCTLLHQGPIARRQKKDGKPLRTHFNICDWILGYRKWEGGGS